MSTKINVIVVDDDPTNAGLIKMLLELDGYAVTTCTDLPQAETAASPTTDVFVVDINLARGASGVDLLHQIRAGNLSTPANATVFMTSGDYRRETEVMEAGANRFLLKPYTPDVLSRAINEIFKNNGKS